MSLYFSVSEIFERIAETIEASQPMLSQLLNGYLTLFCVGSGVILNILCIYVFLKYRNGSPVIQYYLVSDLSELFGNLNNMKLIFQVTLTLWQTALLCNAFLLYCLPTLIYGHVVSSGYYVFVYPFVYAFANTTHTGTVWIILTLTIDRYLALCQPLKHRAIGKRSRVKRLMVAVSILAIFFSVPRFFEVATIYDCDEGGDCIPVVSRTAIVDDKTYWTVYHIVLAMVFVTLVPCLLLFALTLRISIALRQAIVRRKALCAPTSELDGRNKKIACSKKEHRANVMLILVIAKFLISDVLPAIIDVLEHVSCPPSTLEDPIINETFLDCWNRCFYGESHGHPLRGHQQFLGCPKLFNKLLDFPVLGKTIPQKLSSHAHRFLDRTKNVFLGEDQRIRPRELLQSALLVHHQLHQKQKWNPFRYQVSHTQKVRNTASFVPKQILPFHSLSDPLLQQNRLFCFYLPRMDSFKNPFLKFQRSSRSNT